MAKYATGKHSKAISDRSGLQFPYNEMVREWNGSFVHVSEFEPKQPQLEPKPMNGDAISLRHVRPARTEPSVPYLLQTDAFETYAAGEAATAMLSEDLGLGLSEELATKLLKARKVAEESGNKSDVLKAINTFSEGSFYSKT